MNWNKLIPPFELSFEEEFVTIEQKLHAYPWVRELHSILATSLLCHFYYKCLPGGYSSGVGVFSGNRKNALFCCKLGDVLTKLILRKTRSQQAGSEYSQEIFTECSEFLEETYSPNLLTKTPEGFKRDEFFLKLEKFVNLEFTEIGKHARSKNKIWIRGQYAELHRKGS